MATAVTPEQAAMQAPQVAAAEQSPRAEPRRISVDGNAVGLIGVAVGVFSLALVAFTHLSNRAENLDAKIERVAIDLRAEIKDVSGRIDNLDAKIEALARRTDEKINQLGEEMKRYSERTDDKLDKLTDKLNELLINQGRGR